MKGVDDVIIACFLAVLVMGTFMAACAMVFFLTGLFIVTWQKYPFYVLPVQVFLWMALSWFIHHKWGPR